MNAQDLEVRCPYCGAGFAVGTKVCMSCQRPLRRTRAMGSAAGSSEEQTGLESLEPEAPEDEATVEGLQWYSQLVPLAVALAFLLFSLIARQCQS